MIFLKTDLYFNENWQYIKNISTFPPKPRPCLFLLAQINVKLGRSIVVAWRHSAITLVTPQTFVISRMYFPQMVFFFNLMTSNIVIFPSFSKKLILLFRQRTPIIFLQKIVFILHMWIFYENIHKTFTWEFFEVNVFFIWISICNTLHG